MRGKERIKEEYERGLSLAEDPYQLKELASVSTEELAQAVEKGMRYTALAMVQVGRMLYAIKDRMVHGEWEPFVQGRGWQWHYVRGCMKLVEVVAKYPQAAHLPPGRATISLLKLPMSKIDQVMDELPADAIKKMTPWELSKIYDEKKREGKPELTEERAPVPPPSRLAALVSGLTSALNLLAEYEIPKEDYALARRFANEVALRWDAAIYNLTDPAHKGPPPWELGNSDDITEDPQEDED